MIGEWQMNVRVSAAGKQIDFIELQLRPGNQRFKFREVWLGPRQRSPDAIAEARDVFLQAGYAASEVPEIIQSGAVLNRPRIWCLFRRWAKLQAERFRLRMTSGSLRRGSTLP
jgi:hypothetical protein